MFEGFFSRMFYGNPNKPDLKKEDLPQNRFALFFTVLQVRFWQLIQLNLLYVIFWIPALLLTNWQLTLMADHNESLGLFYFLLLIPCLLIAGPATAGATYVMSTWARDEHAWVWSDFKDAWKRNWKRSLLVMLINGIMITVFYINLTFYYALAAKSFAFLVLFYMMVMMAIIFAMMNIYIFPMLITYDLTIMQILKNAFIFSVVKLPQSLGILILSVLLIYFSALYTIPFFLLGLTLPGLIMNSLSNAVFDKYLNSRPEGE